MERALHMLEFHALVGFEICSSRLQVKRPAIPYVHAHLACCLHVDLKLC